MVQTLIEKYELKKYIKSKVEVDDFNSRRLEQLLGEVSLGIESLADAELKFKKASLRYPEINLDFLSTGSKNNLQLLQRDSFHYWAKFFLPSFAVYSLDSPLFRLEYEFFVDEKGYPAKHYFEIRKLKIEPSLPDILRSSFIDAFLFEDSNCSKEIFRGIFESRFVGLIPKEVKQEIRNAKEIFADDIYLVAEANWVKKPLPDPLIIGVVNNNCFLISQFNITSLEEEAIKNSKNENGN